MQCMQCIILGMQIKADIRLTPCLYRLLLSSRWFLRGSTVYIRSGTHKRPSRTWNCVLLAPVRPNSILQNRFGVGPASGSPKNRLQGRVMSFAIYQFYFRRYSQCLT